MWPARGGINIEELINKRIIDAGKSSAKRS